MSIQHDKIEAGADSGFLDSGFKFIVQALISVQALVLDLAQLTCQKRFYCRNAILGCSAILLGTSYSQIVVAVLL